MSWQTEYPTLAMVNSASLQTLQTWDSSLPPPQTDVERTIRRRIKKAQLERAAEEVREKSPSIAGQWNDIMGRLERITGCSAPKM
jgi:hypothetical protein